MSILDEWRCSTVVSSQQGCSTSLDALLELPFRSSRTVLPRMYDVLFPALDGNFLCRLYTMICYQWGRDAFTSEHHYFNSCARCWKLCAGLSHLESSFWEWASTRKRHAAYRYACEDGTVPDRWNVMTGLSTNNGGSLEDADLG